MAGIIVGEVAVATTSIGGVSVTTLFPEWPHVITDINVGLLALVLNIVAMLLVSRVTKPAAHRAQA